MATLVLNLHLCLTRPAERPSRVCFARALSALAGATTPRQSKMNKARMLDPAYRLQANPSRHHGEDIGFAENNTLCINVGK